MNAHNLEALLELWDSPEGHPYKGVLFNRAAYNRDPDDISCMCAQGQVLHFLGGVEPEALADFAQIKADREVAALLGISVTHSVLLRQINDSVDGAPAVVITNPAAVLGDQADTVLAFWRHLDRMTVEQCAAARDAAGNAAWSAAGNAAWNAARDAAGNAAWSAAGNAAWNAARDAAGNAAGNAAWNAAWDAAWNAAWDAAGASNEIQGAALMLERGQNFYFLPMFGFADPEAVLAAEIAA
jgi:hypothetical protein